MDNFQADTYGERIAGSYDELYSGYDETMIATLSELARGGRALELGIGTGRVALPLHARGVSVHGIDASPAMLARLRSKPQGDQIPVTLSNFADVAVEGSFTLIYVVFNTFFALLTQEEQVHCIQNVAGHLEEDGLFVMEAFVPDLNRYTAHQALRVVTLEENAVQLDASQLDPLTQQVTSQHIIFSEKGTQLYPVKLRFAWPAELDLMARLASLRLKHRWGNWNKSGFGAECGKHISVYEPAR